MTDGAEDGKISRRRLRRYLPALTAIVTLASFGVIGWYAYSAGVREGSEVAAPVLKPEGPSRIAPKDPGGRKIPHRGIEVYGVIDGSAGRRPVISLPPPPEKPLPLPVAWKPAPAVKPPPPPPSITLPEKLPPAPKTAAKPASKPASGKGYRVQVASLRSADAAKRAWTKRVKQSGGVLAGLTLFVKRVVIPKKGTYFRVQAGPLLDKVAARRVCESLKRRNIGCLVVKP